MIPKRCAYGWTVCVIKLVGPNLYFDAALLLADGSCPAKGARHKTYKLTRALYDDRADYQILLLSLLLGICDRALDELFDRLCRSLWQILQSRKSLIDFLAAYQVSHETYLAGGLVIALKNSRCHIYFLGEETAL